jgi:hypothetical protein
LTNAELTILSLIAEKPRHGYDIEQVIEARGMRDWTDIGFSSIYYILRKLEKEGLVISAASPAEGKEAEAPNTGLLLGMSLLPALPKEEALEAFRVYKEKLNELISRLKRQAASQQPLPPHVGAMFDYSLRLSENEYHWVEGFIASLEKNE